MSTSFDPNIFFIFLPFSKQIIDKRVNQLKGNGKQEKPVHNCFFFKLKKHVKLGA